MLPVAAPDDPRQTSISEIVMDVALDTRCRTLFVGGFALTAPGSMPQKSPSVVSLVIRSPAAVDVGVGVGVSVSVAVGVGVSVSVGVGVGVSVSVAVAVGVAVSVGVGVTVS